MSFLQRVWTEKTVPLQRVFHRVLVMGGNHHVGISVERNLIQHIVQTPDNTHTRSEGDIAVTLFLRFSVCEVVIITTLFC